ncbi:MAG TPA: hypothetical protein VKT28_08985 [Puia sp.]|nr:hypothetical protein [Puia sp.]
MRSALLTAIATFNLLLCTYAQENLSVADRIINFPNKLFTKINKKANSLDEDLTRQTEKYLQNLAKQESRLKKKLQQQDSVKADVLFAGDPEQKYLMLARQLKNQGVNDAHSMGPEYLPYADSLQGSLSFLNQNSQLVNSNKVLPADIQNSLASLKQLESKLQDADAIKEFIRQRREQIKEYLSGNNQLSPAINNILDDYNKQVFYYQSQVRHCREILNDPDKMLKEALILLNKLPAFTNFMKQNSFLVGLFNVASNYGSPDGIEGLQSRDQVLGMIQNQIGSGGPNAASALQSSLQSAQNDISNMRNKLSKLGAGSGDMDMPNFKPSTQKTKTFFERLEYSTNLQTQHAAYYFPTTTDLGLSVGYKLSDKSTVGIGGSFRAGWGSSFQHISLSGQGGSLRSFIDVNAKKSFYVSGGYEQNFMPSPFVTGGWLSQPSGLVGVSKIVSMTTKFFKKTKLSFLWDFMSYSQVPKGQPVKFRLGYSF